MKVRKNPGERRAPVGHRCLRNAMSGKSGSNSSARPRQNMREAEADSDIPGQSEAFSLMVKWEEASSLRHQMEQKQENVQRFCNKS